MSNKWSSAQARGCRERAWLGGASPRRRRLDGTRGWPVIIQNRGRSIGWVRFHRAMRFGSPCAGLGRRRSGKGRPPRVERTRPVAWRDVPAGLRCWPGWWQQQGARLLGGRMCQSRRRQPTSALARDSVTHAVRCCPVPCAQSEGVAVDAALLLLRQPAHRCRSGGVCAVCQGGADGGGCMHCPRVLA